jgi:hypothetical protein
VCLHPVGSVGPNLRPKSSGPPPHVRLALAASHVPSEVGLDWSYLWGVAADIREKTPEMPASDVFLATVKERGSVVSYQGVHPEQLRICASGDSHDDPSAWRPLSKVTDDQVELFNVDTIY